MAQWSNLPQDLLVSIASRQFLLEEFIRYGPVCRTWKFAATKENFSTGMSHQIPLLMLPEQEDSTTREFYNLKTGKTYKLEMPELAKRRLCYSSLGWLMTQSDQELKVNLLHPLTHAHIELPDLEMFKNSHVDFVLRKSSCMVGGFLVRKFVLSSSPSLTSNYTVMIHSFGKLAFWRPGDHEWTIVDAWGAPCHMYLDITYYKGQFYAVDNLFNVFVCEIEEEPKQARIPSWISNKHRLMALPFAYIEKQYLVESAGTLLVVTRFTKETTEFKVSEVPFSKGKWTTALELEVKTLGIRILFLGYNSSFSVEVPDYSRCKLHILYKSSASQEEEHKDIGISIWKMEQSSHS